MNQNERPLRITPEMLLGRRVDFERRMRRLPPATAGLVGLLALIYLIEVGADALASPEALLAAGALEARAVGAGQYWRLLSATLLHGGLEHLVSNLIALYIVGMVCEHAFGRAQYVVLYVASALGGSLLSVVTSPGPSVGASGAIFGLQGAAIVVFRRYRHRLLMRDRRVGFVLFVWAVYSIAGGLLTPYIDNGAHAGGALAGAVLARWLHPVVLEPMPAAHAARVRGGVWATGALLTYVLVGWLGR